MHMYIHNTNNHSRLMIINVATWGNTRDSPSAKSVFDTLQVVC